MVSRRVFLCSAPLAARAWGETHIPLFDGRTLDGWQVREGPESAFHAVDGAIAVHPGSNFPTWLASAKQYENFDLLADFFVRGWTNSGIYIHAPEHGRNSWCGMKINIFHKADTVMRPESMGAVFPLVAPRAINVREGWNTMRILMDWPRLRVWTNDVEVQDVDCAAHPDLRWRLRRGYIGLESLSYPIRFRNLRIRELPSTDKWQTLYASPADIAKWEVLEGKARWETLGPVLRSSDLGYLATRERFRDFALQMYIRASRWSNGGVIFRGGVKSDAHYEVQVHDVEGAVYGTGSLYGYRRSIYPRIEPEKWFLFQLFVEGKRCVVRINGENVVDYDDLGRNEEAPIMLQAHDVNRWLEYKNIQIKRL